MHRCRESSLIWRFTKPKVWILFPSISVLCFISALSTDPNLQKREIILNISLLGKIFCRHASTQCVNPFNNTYFRLIFGLIKLNNTHLWLEIYNMQEGFLYLKHKSCLRAYRPCFVIVNPTHLHNSLVSSHFLCHLSINELTYQIFALAPLASPLD